MTKGKRILIVEDEAITAMELSDRMRKQGYVVVAVVSTGEEAVEKAIDLEPDVVLMDIKIKGDMNGIEAAQQIHDCCNIPVFYLTAFSDESLLMQAKITEPYGYMIKPFTVREIHSNIEIALYKHEMEQKLKERQTAYRSLIDGTNDMIHSIMPDGSFKFVNRAWLETLGYSEADVQSLRLEDIISPENLQHCQDLYLRTLAGEIITNLEATTVTKDGRQVYVEGNSFPQYEGDKVVAAQCFFRDVTKRKNAEQALRDSEKRLRKVIDLVPHQIFLKDRSGRFLVVNEAVANLYGTTVDQLVGKKHREVHPNPNEVEVFLQEDSMVLKTNEQLHIPEQPFTHSDGNIHWMETSKIPLQLGDSDMCILGVATDITERKIAESALRESEEKYRTLAEKSLQGISIVQGGRIVYANQAYAEVTGHTVEELTAL